MTAELLPPLFPAEIVPLERNPLALYLAQMAPGSRPTTYSSLRRVVSEPLGAPGLAPELFPWWRLRYLHTAAVRSWAAEVYAPATANRILAALRGILRQCYRLDLVELRELERAIDLPAVRGSRDLAGRELAPGELLAMLELCRADCVRPKGARDAAILATLYGGGLRRAELAELELGDLVEGLGELVRSGELEPIHRACRVRGKGNKLRSVFLPEGTLIWLARYLEHRGEESGPLFVRTKRRGLELDIGRRMSVDAVADVVSSVAQRAGVAHWSPHDARRTYIGHLLDAGADLVTVAKLVGHAQVTTTARYDRRGERAKLKASELLHVPT